jgi:hypothetical protein
VLDSRLATSTSASSEGLSSIGKWPPAISIGSTPKMFRAALESGRRIRMRRRDGGARAQVDEELHGAAEGDQRDHHRSPGMADQNRVVHSR